jgi:hypothetical protein
MRTARALAVLLFAAACARAPEESGWKLAGPRTLPKDEAGREPKRDLQRLLEDTASLEKRLGGYPAHFASDEERDTAYREWSDMLLDARVLARPADGVEARMWVLGELYRIGHNLLLRGAAELADDNLSACVAQFPGSLACNESLVMLYLSVKPTPARMQRVERSLETLSDSREPPAEEFAATEYVHLRLVERNAPAARLAIDDYLEKYPEGRAAPQLRSIRPKLEEQLQPPLAEEAP